MEDSNASQENASVIFANFVVAYFEEQAPPAAKAAVYSRVLYGAAEAAPKPFRTSHHRFYKLFIRRRGRRVI